MKLQMIILIAAAIAVVAAAEPGKAPDGAGEGSCTDKGCHADLISQKVVHAPAAEQSCDMCHEHQGEGHAFGLTADPIQEVCTTCHELWSEGDNVHGAVEAGDCVACHNPHSSEAASLLLAEVPDLCITCHDDPRDAGANVHAAAEGGECTMCHSPHASPNRALAQEKIKDLCLGCHDAQSEELAQGPVHGVIESLGCSACHNPHSSDLSRLLRADGKALCTECHRVVGPEAVEQVSDGVTLFGSITLEPDWLDAVPKIALVDGRGHPASKHPVEAAENPAEPGTKFWCGSCHSPHAAPRPKLLKAGSGMSLCLKCHNK